MKVTIHSGGDVGEGEAPDYAPSIDPCFAILLIGVAAYEVKADGSQGRSIDPTYVKMTSPWPSIAPHTDDLELFRDVARGLSPCEALASRDPGRAS